MDVFVLASVAVLSAMMGFWAGRSLQWREEDDERDPRIKRILQGNEIGSPATGTVNVTEENGRREMRIFPEQGKIYAPAAGRIMRLYPMGRAMLLKTEFGAEVLLKAGTGVDDMYSGCYRCRVMEHEYVRKGALLLEYDMEQIAARGAEPEVTVSVENADTFAQISVTELTHMKTGEPLIYMARGNRSQDAGELLERGERVQPFW